MSRLHSNRYARYLDDRASVTGGHIVAPEVSIISSQAQTAMPKEETKKEPDVLAEISKAFGGSPASTATPANAAGPKKRGRGIKILQ